MNDGEQRSIAIDDPDGWRLRIVWSRSGKRAGVSMEKTPGAAEYRQMELRPEQIRELIEFLNETNPQ